MISTACPFCMVMLSDAVTAKQQTGEAKDGVQVLDVSQILARSLVAQEPAMAGAPSITHDVTVEAPKPMDADPAQTAVADYVQLAQTAGTDGPLGDGGSRPAQDPASSGRTTEGSPAVAAPTPAPTGDPIAFFEFDDLEPTA